MKIFREVAITVLIALAVFAVLRLTMQSYTVVMSSMEPNFYQGDCIMVSKVNYRSSGPQRGEVIVFSPPFDSPHPFIKRVIGLPGEIVEIKDGSVSVNGTALDEQYVSAPPNYTMPATVIPEDEYFVLGDNRNNSNDSHTGWLVPRDNVIGRAWFVYWPPSRWRVVQHHSYPELNGEPQQAMMVSQSPEVQFG